MWTKRTVYYALSGALMAGGLTGFGCSPATDEPGDGDALTETPAPAVEDPAPLVDPAPEATPAPDATPANETPAPDATPAAETPPVRQTPEDSNAYLKNMSFETWNGANLLAWDNNANFTERSDDAQDKEASVRLLPPGDERSVTRILQYVGRVQEDMVGKRVKIVLYTKSTEADSAVAWLGFKVNGESYFDRDVAEGTGEWERLTVAIDVPEQIDPDSLALALRLRDGAEEPALFDDLRIGIQDQVGEWEIKGITFTEGDAAPAVDGAEPGEEEGVTAPDAPDDDEELIAVPDEGGADADEAAEDVVE